MSVAAKTIVPERRKSLSSHSSPYRSRPSNRSSNDLIERINEAEARSVRPRSRRGSLVLAERDPRSVDDINAEIAALEAEARARKFERKAFEERDLAVDIRERPSEPEYELVEEKVYQRRPRHEEEIVLYDRERSRNRWGDVYVTPEIREEVVYERRKSPPRNVVRVEKDRKGRLALVRSAH